MRNGTEDKKTAQLSLKSFGLLFRIKFLMTSYEKSD